MKLLLFLSNFSLKNEKPLVKQRVVSLEHQLSAVETGCRLTPFGFGILLHHNDATLLAPDWGHKTDMQKRSNLDFSCCFSSRFGINEHHHV